MFYSFLIVFLLGNSIHRMTISDIYQRRNTILFQQYCFGSLFTGVLDSYNCPLDTSWRGLRKMFLLNISLDHTGLWAYVRRVAFSVNYCMMFQNTVSHPIPRQVVLSCMKCMATMRLKIFTSVSFSLRSLRSAEFVTLNHCNLVGRIIFAIII